jgi:chromosome segregation ATPase
MNIKGGALEFDIIANNGQINSALAETKRRVQGFTDATVEGGERMEAAYREAAAQIEAAFKDIDTMAAIHSNAIADLEKEYARLGEAAGAAFMKGTAKGDEEYRALTAKRQAIKDEISQRKALLQEVANTADALLKEEIALNENKAKVEQNAKAKGMLRTQVMNLKNSLAEMEQNGKRNTDEYRAMQAELGRLADAMADANTQAKIMSDDYQNMNTVLEVMGGISGAFSAAQGAVGLFAGENENLQKIMVKVQSLMAITIGLQQVAKTLNKDSYTQLVLVRKAKELLTVAETKFATALGISNVAAKALMATLTLGLSVAITAAIALISKFISKNREAKKAQEEFNNKVVEAAAEPVTAITELSTAWNRLGNDMAAKNKFIEDNKDRFEDLGFSIRSVKDAEDLLVANKGKFIEACLERAKALAVQELAVEKYKEVLKAQQELEATPKTKLQRGGYYTDGYGVKRKTNAVIEVTNPEWEKAEEAVAKAEREYNALISQQVEFTAKEREILDSIGAGANKVAEGSIEALEKTISELRKKYKEATTDKERAELLAKIKEQEALLKKMDLSGTSSKTTQKDPFTEQLEARKKKYTEYYNWVNSKDEVVRNAAKAEFAGLLKEGSSYLDYLQKQRDQLIKAIGSGTATKTQAEELQKLNNTIANETKETVLAGFEKELKEQLSGARSILEMVNILEEKRKALTGDGSDLDKGKSDIIKKQQEDVEQKAKDRTKALLSEYADYLGKKITFEANYAENSRLLNEQLAKAKTDDERRIALEALANLEKERKKYAKSSGNEDYDALVEEYKTYQQKCADISAQYDEKIALATQQNNEELVAKLQEAKNKALSSAALQELTDSGAWEQLFGNLDDLTTAQIQALIDKIEAQKAQLGVELNPQDLDVVLSKLREAKDEIQTRNPFKALSTALKDYKKDASKANLSEVFKGVGATADLVKGSFDAVTGAIEKMGGSMDDETQAILGDVGGIVDGIGQMAQGYATMNPAQMIQGAVGMLTSVFDLFNSRDRKAERAIKKHAAAVEELERAYKALEHAVDKALGESVYDNQKALINNMREQRAHLRAMWEAEESKKKTDSGKVNQYKEQYEELGRQIEDTIAEITESVTQTSAKDLATQLSDAIAEAYSDGFNSDKVKSAIEKVTNQVLGNAVKNALKKQFLEQQLQNAVKQLQRDMGFDDEGGGSFDGLTPEEQQRFKDRVKSIAQGYAEALKLYEDLFKDLDDNGDPTTSLSGAIKGASQESIDLLAGQTNAVRVNQVQEIEILRQQLIHLANIDGKLSVSNRHLEQIEKNTSGSASDPLRAQGITM